MVLHHKFRQLGLNIILCWPSPSMQHPAPAFVVHHRELLAYIESKRTLRSESLYRVGLPRTT